MIGIIGIGMDATDIGRIADVIDKYGDRFLSACSRWAKSPNAAAAECRRSISRLDLPLKKRR